MSSLLCGAAFGAAMMSSGFHEPSIIISQLKFENWHMLQAFLVATASSALSYTLIAKTGRVMLQPRGSSPLGMFSQYDGNILGGMLLGAGIALSGSCPGTLFVQIAAHVKSGLFALNGAIIGGLLWTGYLSRLARRSREMVDVKPIAATVHERLKVSRWTALLSLVAGCISVTAITTALSPRFPGTIMPGVAGGLSIGFAQLFSLMTRRSMIGVSAAFDESASFIWWVINGERGSRQQPQPHQNLTFAIGAVAGAWVLLQAFPSLAFGPVREVSPFLATAGGVLMSLGSRMAGGCTSGHGISGMSLLSMSSIITIVSLFATGAIIAQLVY